MRILNLFTHLVVMSFFTILSSKSEGNVGNSNTYSLIHDLVTHYRQDATVYYISGPGSNSILFDGHEVAKWNAYTKTKVGRNNSLHVVENNLNRRWFSMKKSFGHLVVVSVPDFRLLTQILKLLGPNMTEDATLFVDYLKDWKRMEFVRDTVFLKMLPKLVLLRTEEHGKSGMIGIGTAQLICPLCKDNLILPPISLSGRTDLTSLNQNVQTLFHTFVLQNAHGTAAWLFKPGPRGYISSNNHHKSLELTAYFHSTVKTDKDAVMLGIFMNRFNFSIMAEPDGYDLGNYSGLYLGVGVDMPGKGVFGRQLTLSYSLSEHFLYCRKKPVIRATGFDFFWSPFEYNVWIAIAATTVILTLVHKLQLDYGLDVVWSVLGIPWTADWRKDKVTSYFLVLLVNLNIGYLSVITSKVIIPNKEIPIPTIAQLFQTEGFRIAETDPEGNGKGVITYLHEPLLAVGVNNSIENGYIVKVDKCAYSSICIGYWAGLATWVFYAYELERNRLEIPPEQREKCLVVTQPLRTYLVGYYSQGPPTPNVYWTHQSLIATGIDNFWSKNSVYISYYSAFRKANHTADKGPQPLNFETPILVVFKAFGVLLGICLGGFAMEWGYFLVRKRCESGKG